MKKTLPIRVLPQHLDLDQLKRQAKELLNAVLAGEPDAVSEAAARYPGVIPERFALHDAQLVLARAYGFQSWPKLRAYLNGATMQRLRDAIRAGDSEQVRHLLKLRPEMVNAKISDADDRPLLYAVVDHKPEMVRLLLEFGADSHAYAHPLTLARERGYDEIVALITDAERRRGTPPAGASAVAAPANLMDMLRNGEESEAIALLEAHPDLINSGDPEGGATPLHCASAYLLEKTAEWLVANGANVDARSQYGNAPVDVVGQCKNGTPEQVRTMRTMLLTAGAARTARLAVAEGNADWLRARHAEGTLGNPFYGGDGLLSLAVKYDRPEILTLLLDLGFDPDERRSMNLEPPQEQWGQPLRHCAVAGKLAMAEMLLARGADPNGHIWASGTPLYAGYRNVAMRELLERHGGYLDAELVGYLRLTEKAKEMLADEAAGRLRPEAMPHPGGTVGELLMLGCGDDEEMLRIALPHVHRAPDDEWWSERLNDARCGNPECFRLVLERCGDLVRRPDVTVLRGIADEWPQLKPDDAKERVAQATILLDAGAKLSARHEFHKTTALGHACRWGAIELVKLYLERGADPVEADAEPWARPRARPLALAEKYGHANVATTLREKGAT